MKQPPECDFCVREAVFLFYNKSRGRAEYDEVS